MRRENTLCNFRLCSEFSGFSLDQVTRYGKPFAVDAKTLSRAKASSVLALSATVIGASLALPLDPPRIEMRHGSGMRGAEGAKESESTQVAVVSIDGPLSQRGEEHMCGYLDGYDWITSRFSEAMTDPRVGAVVLRINSPGGDVSGLEEAVRRMRAVADDTGKRVVAFVDEFAASAAYWIASGVADEIWLPTCGEVGSIGVIGTWVDMTGAYEAEGYDVHVVREPSGKAPGTQVKPDAKLANERLTESVRSCAARFFAAVAGSRGMSAKTVEQLNGETFESQSAIDKGLADHVGSFEDAIAVASAAAMKRKSEVANESALAALGLKADATDEQIKQAAATFALGNSVLAETKAESPDAALATVIAHRDSHDAATTERAALAKERAVLDAAERVAMLTSLIAAGWETPATAWAQDDEGLPVAGTPSESWASASLESLRTRAKTLGAQPREHGGGAIADAAQANGETVATAKIVSVDGVSVALSEAEVRECHESAGDDEANRARVVKRYAEQKARQGNFDAISFAD